MRLRVGVLSVFLATAVACGGAQPPGPAAGPAGAAPAMPVEVITLAPKSIEETAEFVGTVKSRRSDDDPAAGRRLPDTDRRDVRRSGERRHGAVRDRRRAPAGGRGQSRVHPRRARGRCRARAAEGGARRHAARRRRHEPAGRRTGHDAPEDGRRAGFARSTNRFGSSATNWRYYRVTAPTSGVIGDIPVRRATA